MLPPNVNARLSDKPEVVILTAGYDGTSSFSKGSVFGPAKIMECFDTQIEMFDRVHKKATSSLIKIAHEDLGDLNDREPEDVISQIEARYQEILATGSFPILVGGEHSVSIGAFRALGKKIDPKTVTIVQIDAHLDLRDDDSDYHEHPTKLAHSAVMRRAHDMGYHLIQVGARAYSEEEYLYVQNHQETITMFEWNKQIPTTDQILAAIRTPYVYLTIDADGIDPSHLPGTGTPVQGGLEWYYFFGLLDKIMKNCEIAGADIVEVAPQSGSVVTEYGAAQILYTICGYRIPENK